MIEFLETCNNIIGCEIAKSNASPVFVLLSFLGGIVSSISPCTLGILPVIVGYVVGYNEKRTFKTFLNLLFFTLGLSFVMSIVGIISVIFGHVFVSVGGNYFVLFISSLLIVLGLDLINVIEINFPQLIKKMPKSNNSFLYPFLTGMFFALASTPCSTPILVSILGFASLTENIPYSILLLFAYAMGQSIIIIITGVFASFVVNLKMFKNIGSIFMKIAGILLILTGLYFMYNVFSQFI